VAGAATTAASENAVRALTTQADGVASITADADLYQIGVAQADGVATTTASATQVFAENLHHFRWRYDDGDEDEANWRAVEDADITLPIDTPVRLRLLVRAPAGGQYQLEAAEVGTENWFAIQEAA